MKFKLKRVSVLTGIFIFGVYTAGLILYVTDVITEPLSSRLPYLVHFISILCISPSYGGSDSPTPQEIKLRYDRLRLLFSATIGTFGALALVKFSDPEMTIPFLTLLFLVNTYAVAYAVYETFFIGEGKREIPDTSK